MVNLSFNESVQNGTLCDDFKNMYGNGLTRDEAKDIMFKALFSRNGIYKNRQAFPPYRKEKEIFAKVFQMVAEIVETLKEKDQLQLAIHLQTMESFVFIDSIAKKLVDNKIVPITIHDSEFVPKHQEAEALKIVGSVFMELFVTIPTFHIEPLKK